MSGYRSIESHSHKTPIKTIDWRAFVSVPKKDYSYVDNVKCVVHFEYGDGMTNGSRFTLSKPNPPKQFAIVHDKLHVLYNSQQNKLYIEHPCLNPPIHEAYTVPKSEWKEVFDHHLRMIVPDLKGIAATNVLIETSLERLGYKDIAEGFRFSGQQGPFWRLFTDYYHQQTNLHRFTCGLKKSQVLSVGSAFHFAHYEFHYLRWIRGIQLFHQSLRYADSVKGKAEIRKQQLEEGIASNKMKKMKLDTSNQACPSDVVQQAINESKIFE